MEGDLEQLAQLADVPIGDREEVLKQVPGAQRGREDSEKETGEQSPWDFNDPLFSEVEFHQNTSYLLGTRPTILRLMLLYAFGDLDDSDVDAVARALGYRILMPANPPLAALAKVSNAKKFIHYEADADAGIQPNFMVGIADAKKLFHFGTEWGVPINASGMPQGKILVRKPARWLKLSPVKMQWSGGRSESGLWRMPYGPIPEEFDRFAKFIVGRDNLALPATEFNQEQRDRLLILSAMVRGRHAKQFLEHPRMWRAYTEALDNSGDESKQLVQFQTWEMWRDWEKARDIATDLPNPRALENAPEEYRHVQTIPESTDAAIALERMASTIIAYPILEETPHSGRDGKTFFTYDPIQPGDFVCNGPDEFNMRRKLGGTFRKSFQATRGAHSVFIADKGDPRKYRDNWGYGPIDGYPVWVRDPQTGNMVTHRNLRYSSVMDPEAILDWVARLPRSFYIPDGARQAEMMMQIRVRVPDSYANCGTMLDRIDNGEIIPWKDLSDKYKFINWDSKRIFWAWFKRKKNGDPVISLKPKRGYQVAAVHRSTMSLYTNTLWTLLQEHLIFPEGAEAMNHRFEMNGWDLRITYDGPESNYFRIGETAQEIWRLQPLVNIRKHLNHVVMPIFEAGKYTDLRKEIVKFFEDLPDINENRHDVTYLMEDYLRWADKLALSSVLFKDVHMYARAAGPGAYGKLLDDGIFIYPTESMTNRYPGDMWGSLDPEGMYGGLYSPYTFEGMQKARGTIGFMGYDAGPVIDVLKGLVESLVAGRQVTVEEVVNKLRSALEGRKIWSRRVKNFIKFAKKATYLVPEMHGVGVKLGKQTILEHEAAHEALQLIDEAIELMIDDEESVSKQVDRFGIIVLREGMGLVEASGEGGAIDAILSQKHFEWARKQLPGG